MLELNWWETAEHQDEQRAIAEELHRIMLARREHGAEDEDGDARLERDAWSVEGTTSDSSKLVAKTRVGASGAAC